MRKSDFHYDLPEALIAQQPLPERTASRLLVLNGDAGQVEDRLFTGLPDLLHQDDLFIVNDTRVVPARLFGRKESGGHCEFLIERVLDDRHALAQVRVSKPIRPEQRVVLDEGSWVETLGREGEFHRLRFHAQADEPLSALLERLGHMPLPPYITRDDDTTDRTRYQTLYAREPGAVAAPTAGLHFDAALLARLDAAGIARASITLHVGAGTFKPVRDDDLSRHVMHAERYHIPEATAWAVNQARREGRRIVAVGTTSVRALESAWRAETTLGGQVGGLVPGPGETRLFITPGHAFRAVDALITNFHLPESTLLMLVCAFGGTEHVLAAYRHAVLQRYRFFSYGDAMFVTAARS